MAAPLVSLSHPVLTIRRRMAPFATHTARMDTLVSVPSAGRTALTIPDSVMMAPTVTSLMPTVAVPVRSTSVATARSGVLSGTQLVTRASTTLDVAYAHLTAHLA